MTDTIAQRFGSGQAVRRIEDDGLLPSGVSVSVGGVSQQQAEAIAPWPQRRVLVSSEGETQPLFSAPVPPRLLRLASTSRRMRR